jgi:SAM-dependent methyltransferase
MSLHDYYEDSYSSERGKNLQDLYQEVMRSAKLIVNYVQECKMRFLPQKDWQGLKVLELGCGRGGVGLHLAKLGAQVTLVDFSEAALTQAQGLFALDGLEAKTVVGDVTHPDLALHETYDIIIDSHLLHCLTEDPDRASYYQLVHQHLGAEGIFVAETMVHRKKLFIPDGFMFDERNVLWQMFGKWTPVRRILDSLDLEQEILSAGFHITYFYYYAQFSFVPHQSFMDLPAEILPASVRMVLQKKA